MKLIAINIGHWADSARFENEYIYITYSGLMWRCFKIPNTQYSVISFSDSVVAILCVR